MKTFFKSSIFLFFCLSLVSCGAMGAASKAEKEAERAAIVQAIENQHFVLDITRIIPRGFPTRTSTGEYQLLLDGDVVTTRLPFLGESREAVYGGIDEISIVFEKEKVAVSRDFSNAGKGEYLFQFSGGKSREKWIVTLQLYDSGYANIGCSSGSKYMSYIANILIPEDARK